MWLICAAPSSPVVTLRAHYPVQAAAGFLTQVDGLPDMLSAPFDFPARFSDAMELVRKEVRTFTTTSVGRLFDTAAALLGFTRQVTFEGQAAIWVEQLARSATMTEPYALPFRRWRTRFSTVAAGGGARPSSRPRCQTKLRALFNWDLLTDCAMR